MLKKIVPFVLILSATSVFGQSAEIVKFNALEKILHTPSDKIQVVNFWATWCAPCVKELPLFEVLNDEAPKDVEITLINLDFADKLDKVNAFIVRKNMKSKVLLLDEIDYNKWIDRVDQGWSGAIPATLIVNTTTGKRKFVEKELEKGDLEKMVKEVQ